VCRYEIVNDQTRKKKRGSQRVTRRTEAVTIVAAERPAVAERTLIRAGCAQSSCRLCSKRCRIANLRAARLQTASSTVHNWLVRHLTHADSPSAFALRATARQA
jgi:hypothetical protein